MPCNARLTTWIDKDGDTVIGVLHPDADVTVAAAVPVLYLSCESGAFVPFELTETEVIELHAEGVRIDHEVPDQVLVHNKPPTAYLISNDGTVH